EEIQRDKVHPAVYDRRYGIKALSNPVTERARKSLLAAIRWLRKEGAEAVILGCTEIPLAIPEKKIDGVVLIDPTLILARSLIKAVSPAKLRPLRKD
ncbi:MAG: aspartate/glutamate racemase family protein, partial [Bacteroidota bacterium]